MVSPNSQTSLYQKLVDLQKLSNKLSVPWISTWNTLSKSPFPINMDAYSELMKTYSSLADLYRMPTYSDSSAFIRQDTEDKKETITTSNSTKSETPVLSTETTGVDDVNKANQEYLEYLRTRTDEIANAISRTEFEDGMDNDITILIKSFAKRNKSATYNWLDELYSKNLDNPSVVQGILRSLAMITERGDENILLPIVVAGLRSKNSAEQEAAIMVIEEWRTKECLNALRSVTSFSSEMITNYAKMVTDELSEELNQ